MQMYRHLFLAGLAPELRDALNSSGTLQASAFMSSDDYDGTDLPKLLLAAIDDIQETVDSLADIHGWCEGLLPNSDIIRTLLAGLFVVHLRDLATRMTEAIGTLKELESYGRLDFIERDEEDQPVELEAASAKLSDLLGLHLGQPGPQQTLPKEPKSCT